jgi:hypothetical protein
MNGFIRAECVCIFYQHCFVATASSRQAQGANPAAAEASKQKHRYTDSCIELYKPSEFYFLSYFTTRNILHADKGFIPAHTRALVPQHSLCVAVPC